MPLDVLPGRVSPDGEVWLPDQFPQADDGHGIWCSLMVQGGTTTDASSFVTASYNPPPGSLLLIFFDDSITGSEPAVSSVTGNGLTYDLVNSVFYKSSGNNLKLFCYRAMSDTPTVGAITIDFGGVPQTGCRWQIVACSKVEQGANGANAIAQSNTAFNTVALGSPLDVVLSNPRFDDYSRCVAGFGNNSSAANSVIPRDWWRELAEGNHGTPSQTLETQFRPDFFEATASGIQNSTTLAMGGIAIELIQAGPAAAPSAPERAPIFPSQYLGFY